MLCGGRHGRRERDKSITGCPAVPSFAVRTLRLRLPRGLGDIEVRPRPTAKKTRGRAVGRGVPPSPSAVEMYMR